MRFSAADGSQHADILPGGKGFHFSEHVPILLKGIDRKTPRT
jgi:hypothetical protein